MARAEGIDTQPGGLYLVKHYSFRMHLVRNYVCLELGSLLYQMYMATYSVVVVGAARRKHVKGSLLARAQDAACLTEYAISFYRSAEAVTCRQDLWIARPPAVYTPVYKLVTTFTFYSIFRLIELKLELQIAKWNEFVYSVARWFQRCYLDSPLYSIVISKSKRNVFQ